MHPNQHDQQGSHRRSVERTLDEISLPVSRDPSVFNLGRAHMKTHYILNLAPSILTACSRAPDASGLSQGQPSSSVLSSPLGITKERCKSFRATPTSPARQDNNFEVCQRFAPETNVHGENIQQRQTVPYEDQAWAIVASGIASHEPALRRPPPHISAH